MRLTKCTSIARAVLTLLCVAGASCALDSGGGNAINNTDCPTFDGGSYLLTVVEADDPCGTGFASQSGRIVRPSDSSSCDGSLEQTGCHVELLNSACGSGATQDIVLDFNPDTETFDGTTTLTLLAPACSSNFVIRLTPVE